MVDELDQFQWKIYHMHFPLNIILHDTKKDKLATFDTIKNGLGWNSKFSYITNSTTTYNALK